MNNWNIRKTAIVEQCKICGREYKNHNDYIMHISYERRKDLVKLRAKLWAKNNPEKRKKIIKQNNDRSIKRKSDWWVVKHFHGKIVRDYCRICLSNKKLLIHHIDGKNGKGYKSLNNNPNNLVILCQSCHPKVHNSWWLKDWREVYERMAY